MLLVNDIAILVTYSVTKEQRVQCYFFMSLSIACNKGKTSANDRP